MKTDMYNPTCVITGKKDNLRMHASRNSNGDMTGWVFVHESIDIEKVKPHVDYEFEAAYGPELRSRLREPQPQREIKPVQEPAKPDYSGLIGKWVRCIRDLVMKSGSVDAIKGKWYQINSGNSFINEEFIAHYFGGHRSHLNLEGGEWAKKYFDLDNPRDTNPDEEERVIPFDLERWRKGDFVRVETRDGREPESISVNQLDVEYPITGLLGGCPTMWDKTGRHVRAIHNNNNSLMLVVKGGEK